MKKKFEIILVLLGIITFSVSLFSSAKIITQCYRPYGCFHLGGRYISLWRPFNMIPLPPDIINVSFGLRTRKNPVQFQVLDDRDFEKVRNSNFNPKLPIVFIIHGYLENNRYQWIKHMSSELLKYENMNVIAVDWEDGGNPPYALACANLRLTGAIVAYFIHSLMEEFHVVPEQIHIIGHSLGAHIAGEIGDRVPGIRRITGLDPAMMLFYKVHRKLRIDAADAKFVDIIHTNGKKSLVHGLGLGMDEPCGHMDFYPNGGRKQPGCQPHILINKVQFDREGLRYILGCNHIRAYQFFTESINSQCPFTSFFCHDWNDFEDGKCADCGPDGKFCAHLGYHANNSNTAQISRNKYYLITSKNEPYCLFQRKITIKTETDGSRGSYDPRFGQISIDIRGGKGVTEYKRSRVDPSTHITFMTGTYSTGPIHEMNLNWKRKIRLLHPWTWFEKADISVNEIIVESIDFKRRERFCANHVHLPSGGSISFEHCR